MQQAVAEERQETTRQALQTTRAAAARLGRERRRLFLAGTVLGLVAPVLPYLTGTWETAWYALAGTGWPLALRAALFLLLVHLALAVVLAPLAYYGGHVLPRQFGLSRQTPRGWLADWGKGVGLMLVFGLLAGGGYLWAATRLGGAWWWAFGLYLGFGTVLLVFLAPYVLLPLFFKARPLGDPLVERRMQALLRRTGLSVQAVQQLDFSRRTQEANAAVLGMGRSRRLVLADTLLAEFAPDEIDAVVAHEIGHHVHRDVPRLMALQLLVLWVGLALAGRWADAALPVLSLPYLGYVPGYPEVLAVANLYLLVAAPLVNWWSRRVETAADRYALAMTPQPQAFASALRRLASQNLAELAPPRWAQLLLGSHPAVGQRIDMAESWPS